MRRAPAALGRKIVCIIRMCWGRPDHVCFFGRLGRVEAKPLLRNTLVMASTTYAPDFRLSPGFVCRFSLFTLLVPVLLVIVTGCRCDLSSTYSGCISPSGFGLAHDCIGRALTRRNETRRLQ